MCSLMNIEAWQPKQNRSVDNTVYYISVIKHGILYSKDNYVLSV